MKQANWYNMIPDDIRSGFPSVRECIQKDGDTKLIMEYVEMKPLNESIIQNMISCDQAVKALGSVLKWVSETMWTKKQLKTHDAFELMIQQCEFRHQEMLKLNVPLYNTLVNSKEVIVNGEVIFGGYYALKKLRSLSSLLNKMNRNHPNVIVHGDLHTGNILHDVERLQEFKLIDPRGDFPNGDIYYAIGYDSGKMLHDLHSCFSLIRAGDFTLDIVGDCELKYQIKRTSIWHSYEHLLYWFRTWCEENGLCIEIEDWWPSAFLFEALLLTGIVIFHARHFGRSIVLYLQGLVLLNRWLQWAEGKLPVEILFKPLDDRI